MLIPSPFEVPMFDACEIQMQGHIINLQHPSEPSNISKELSLITQQLAGKFKLQKANYFQEIRNFLIFL
jgi:hypothetical protein